MFIHDKTIQFLFFFLHDSIRKYSADNNIGNYSMISTFQKILSIYEINNDKRNPLDGVIIV